MKIWRERDIDRLGGATASAAACITELIERRAVTLDVSGNITSTGSILAWGQYLDDDHGGDQWGVYGTTAAIQALALNARYFRGEDALASDHFIHSGLALLPDDVRSPPSALRENVDRGDLENVVRLAYIVETLQASDHNVHTGDEPALVEQLLARAVSGTYWSSRIPRVDRDESRQKDKIFPTAYVLLGLSRYAAGRGSATYRAARTWLSQQALNDQRTNTPSMMALIGLALLLPLALDQDRPQVVSDALARCDEIVVNWARAQKKIALERPTFFGFSLGTRNDYNFFQTEILAAVYLLRRGNPPRGRSFVLRLLDILTNNVLQHDGFMNENRMKLTVSQMWVLRLVVEFHNYRVDGRWQYARLLPSRDLRLTFANTWARLTALAALLATVLGIILLTATSIAAGLLSFGVGVLLLLAGLFLVPTRLQK